MYSSFKHLAQNGSFCTALVQQLSCSRGEDPTTQTVPGLSCLKSTLLINALPTENAHTLTGIRMGWSPTLTWLRWGPKYHLHRKILQPPFTKSRVGEYTVLQRREALICCKSMIDNPDDWLNSIRRFAVAVVLKIAYGLEVDGPNSPWIELADDTANAIGKSGAPASSIMDRFPASR